MIVTYTLSLRGACGESTIVVPKPLQPLSDIALLIHIQEHCLLHYNNKQIFPKDHLQDSSKILLILIKETLF